MKTLKLSIAAVAVMAALAAGRAEAHQPIIVPEGAKLIEVTDPEVSKAYYAEMIRDQQYVIRSDKPFDLYLNILVPKFANPEGRYSLVVVREDGGTFKEMGRLEGGGYFWSEIFEPFGRDWYFKSVELRAKAPAGTYYIPVYGNGDKGKYVLAVGEKEKFGLVDGWKAARTVPKLKRDFFHSSPFSFLLSPIGAAFAVAMLVAGFLVGLVYRFLVRRLAKSEHLMKRRNLGSRDRLLRLGIFLVAGIAGVYFWSVLLLMFAGFALFEAIVGWCGLYAFFGRDTHHTS